MNSAQVFLGLALALSVGCRHDDRPTPPAAPVVPSVSGAAATSSALALTLSSTQGVPGLRVETGSLGHTARWGYSELIPDPRFTQLRIRQAQGGAALQDLLSSDSLAVVNGGYFEADFTPSSWLVDSSVELAPKADSSKGGVLALGAAGPYVGPMAGLPFQPLLAVQSFPLLVEAEGKPGVHRDDGRRAARTIACLVDDALHFIVIAAQRGDGPTLFETAELLRTRRPAGFGCRRALNLDGGPSSGAWFAPQLHAKQRPPFAKVAYAIAIGPRPVP